MPRKKIAKPVAPPPAAGQSAAPAAHPGAAAPAQAKGRPSPLVDTRVIYCGDNLEQLKKLPDACIELARALKKTGSFYHPCDWHASPSSWVSLAA